MSNNKHLTRDERMIIERAISNGSSKTSIADILLKDNSTIGKEIKLHRFIKVKAYFHNECINYKKCKHDRICTETCLDYKKFKCSRRDRSPGACNGCSRYPSCRFTKYWYSADLADKNYRASLVDSREGVNLTTQEAITLGTILKEGLDKGHSIYHIKVNHPEITQTEKTLYNYIDQHVFSVVGLSNIDLRNKVGRQIPKKTSKNYKKRKDNHYLIGRKYKDYESFIADATHMMKVVEMDTVYNHTTGPFIQTFFIRELDTLIAVYHETKTAEAMVAGFHYFVECLGIHNFYQVCDCILTDRGSEFSLPDQIEVDKDGTYYCKVFFCDPMASCQKAGVEKEHVYLRYILPKGYSLTGLGLNSQEALNKVISHINSFPREKRNGKTPFQLIRFYYEDMIKELEKKDIIEVPASDVILKPYLLKK